MITARLRRLISFVTLAILLALPHSSAGAEACPGGLAPQFEGLEQAIGGVMGAPVGCSRVDADGSVVQVTTTGLAISRPDGMSVFAAGERHWALSDQGLQAWTGNWHNGLYPPITPPAHDDSGMPVASSLATIEPLTLVRLDQDPSLAIVVEDVSGSTFAVQTLSGCLGLAGAVGDHVFLRSDGRAADLILVRQHETCEVASVLAADDD